MELFVSSTMGPKLIYTLAQDTSMYENPCGYLIPKSDDTEWGLHMISKLPFMHYMMDKRMDETFP